MPGTNVVATPQPWRLRKEPEARNSFESEQWDDMANVVWDLECTDSTQIESLTTTVGTQTIPCPVATRLEITVSGVIFNPAVAGAFGRIHVNDGATTDVIPFTDLAGNGIGGCMTRTGTYDVPPGQTTLTVTVESSAAAGTYTFARLHLIVRRGRKPVT